MNCAEYELELTSFLNAGRVCAEDAERLLAKTAMKRHAAVCEACAGTSAVLEWLAADEAQRDWVPDPGEAYWSTFNARLHSRAAREARDATVDAAPRRAMVGWISAVAALLVVALGVGWFSWPRTSPTRSGAPSEQASNPVGEPVIEEPPRELVEWLAAEDDPAFGEPEGLLPALDELDGLDDDGREALLDWLNERNAAAEGVS